MPATEPVEVRNKFVLFSRRVWGWFLGVGGTLLLLLSAATPDSVAYVMTPFVELADALGWVIEPESQDRARRAILAIATIIGITSLARSRVAPDGANLTAMPSAGKAPRAGRR